MGTLTKVAAGAASLIPFHCVICFDEFNLTDRVPMVLPCGHTYVCHRCTKRLNRCMECREPLFMSVPSSAFAATSSAASSSSATAAPTGGSAPSGAGRYSPLSLPPHSHTHGGGGGPPPSMVKIPLAIPKNVVLISLMEAAQRQKVEDKKDEKLSTATKRAGQPNRRQGDDEDDDDDDDSSVGSDDQQGDEDESDDNEEFDLDRIISGMATFSGPCGTYAVTVDHHVVVQPNDPRAHQHQQQHERSAAEGEEKKSDDLAAGTTVADDTDPTGNGGCSLEVEVDDDGEARPVSPLSTADVSVAAEIEKDETKVMEDADDDDKPRKLNCHPEPFVLRKGQTVQVVDLNDKVAKLARGMGYIVLGATSHLVKVGGPLDAVCRLEGLLGTIEGRGRDLQATLDENRLVELSLLQQIADAMKAEPRHPVITVVADLEVWRHDDEDAESDDEDRIRGRNKENVIRSGATATATAASSSLGHPRTPDSRRRDSGSHHSLTGSVDSVDSRTAHVNVPSQSPISIDNADLHRGAAIPVYRRTVSEDDIDQLVFGCGVAFLGGDGSSSASGLFSGAPNILGSEDRGPQNPAASSSSSTSSSYASSVLAARPRSATDHLGHGHGGPHHDYAGPTLTSSFDGIDFRTGMSGHRGLNHLASKSSAAHYSPTPRYRSMRLMSEHRGIARPLSSRRESPTGAPAISATPSSASAASGTVPAFGPRLSLFPPHVGGGDEAATAAAAAAQYR